MDKVAAEEMFDSMNAFTKYSQAADLPYQAAADRKRASGRNEAVHRQRTHARH